jgi:hypothetical protein
MLRAEFAYDVHHVARVSCKCCVHLLREEHATRDVLLLDPSVRCQRMLCPDLLVEWFARLTCNPRVRARVRARQGHTQSCEYKEGLSDETKNCGALYLVSIMPGSAHSRALYYKAVPHSMSPRSWMNPRLEYLCLDHFQNIHYNHDESSHCRCIDCVPRPDGW